MEVGPFLVPRKTRVWVGYEQGMMPMFDNSRRDHADPV
ncbi:hypothetical protein BQ8420_10925 [Nocardiopsis sp. JB363]|nr:hypothetical protein BQ8420_10925 [Nocardiopsis sp. JB363]